MDCVICFEKRKRGFACPTCVVWTCLPCYEKSLDEYGIMCMACHTAIPENRWYDLFPKTFIQKRLYTKSSIELFERYRAQLPTVQDGAEAVLECRDLRVQLVEVEGKIRAHQQSLTKYQRERDAEIQQVKLDKDAELAKLREYLRLKTAERDAAVQAVMAARNGLVDKCRRFLTRRQRESQEIRMKLNHRQGIVDGTITKFEKIRRVVRCLGANCNAFLDDQMHCGVCRADYCSECHELKHEGGEACDPNKVADLLYLKRNTRDCPQCGTKIQKIEGCDQMFCVVPECHTFFSYQTGKEIRSGPLHNPHYIERLRAGGVVNFRQDRPAGCNDLPALPTLIAALAGIPADPVYASILNFHQSIAHITDAIILNPEEPRYVRQSMIKFLLGTTDLNAAAAPPYTKDMFIADIQTHFKTEQHRKEVQQVLTTCRDVAKDVFGAYLAQPSTIAALQTELIQIAGLTNDELLRISKVYGWKPREVFITDPANRRHLEFRATRYARVFQPWTPVGQAEIPVDQGVPVDPGVIPGEEVIPVDPVDPVDQGIPDRLEALRL